MSRFVLTFAVFKCFDAVLFCSLMNVTSKSKNVKLARFSFVFLSYSDQTNGAKHNGENNLYFYIHNNFGLCLSSCSCLKLFLARSLCQFEADSSDSHNKNNKIYLFKKKIF